MATKTINHWFSDSTSPFPLSIWQITVDRLRHSGMDVCTHTNTRLARFHTTISHKEEEGFIAHAGFFSYHGSDCAAKLFFKKCVFPKNIFCPKKLHENLPNIRNLFSSLLNNEKREGGFIGGASKRVGCWPPPPPPPLH